MPTDAPRPAGPPDLHPAAGGIPRFRRARSFHLYDTRGRRYLDLARSGAFLGHRPAGMLNAMKAALSQGLAADVPSVWEARLAAHIARVFPAYPVVTLYATPERAMKAAARCLHAAGESLELVDPALPGLTGPDRGARPDAPRGRCGAAGEPRAALWRPLLPVPAGARALLPLLPFTSCGAPAPVCLPAPSGEGVAGDTIPGYLCAGALRALAALAAPGLPARFSPASPRLAAALEGRQWARTGPYVRALFPEAVYARVHAEFLREGVLLCPVYPGPSVLPGECSPGETNLLADLFASIPGG